MPIKRGEMGGPAERAFGRLIRGLRRERGVSQEKLAELSGCDRSYLSFLERGINSPSLSMIFQLAAGLGIRPSQLLVSVEAAIEDEEPLSSASGAPSISNPAPDPGARRAGP